MTNFDDIRPYHDEEVRPVLERLLATPEFKATMARLSFPRLSQYLPGLLAALAGWYLRRQIKDIHCVTDVQHVVESYMAKMMERTMNGLTCSGLEKLDPNRPYFFVSNHRDISSAPVAETYVTVNDCWIWVSSSSMLASRP